MGVEDRGARREREKEESVFSSRPLCGLVIDAGRYFYACSFSLGMAMLEIFPSVLLFATTGMRVT